MLEERQYFSSGGNAECKHAARGAADVHGAGDIFSVRQTKTQHSNTNSADEPSPATQQRAH